MTNFFDQVCDELRVYCYPDKFLPIAECINSWEQTRNPHYMDKAQLLCLEAGAPITPTLQAALAQAAQLRMTGDTAGTAHNVYKEAALNSALMYMLNFHHAGLSVPAASRKAQALFGQKASTLERYYGERMRPEPEATYREMWRVDIPNHAQLWKPVIDAIPDPVE